VGDYKTPLRYPGGKQRIWPFIADIVATNNLTGGHYVEAYAGGAGIAMELLLRGIVSRVHLNDSCKAVYSFWHSVINQPEKLCRRISRASLTISEWRRQREIIKRPLDVERLELGFAMFYLNRCNRSGILNAGVIGGLAQQGKWKLDARFPRNELIRRIEAIADKKDAIKIRNWDAARFLLNYIPKLPPKTLVYCDPPYYLKADRLYMNYYTNEDHECISNIIQEDVTHPWVISYDNASAISELYKRRRTGFYSLQYNAAKVYKGEELFIFSDNITLPSRSSVPAIDFALSA
jgi:DNA adenine methylase